MYFSHPMGRGSREEMKGSRGKSIVQSKGERNRDAEMPLMGGKRAGMGRRILLQRYHSFTY